MQGLAFVVCNFLAIVFLLIPAPWHLSARNAPTLLYIFWCAVTIVPMALNSAIWYDHLGIKAPIYCDIVTKLRVGGDVGIPASILCIARQLEAIAAARQSQFNGKDRRRQRYIDAAIGLGLPVLVMVLHVVVQGHRYDIVQGVGCVPAYYWSLPLVFIIWIWPVLLLLVAAIYAVLAVRLFIARRYQFARLLESSKSAISTSRFIRLIALSAFQIAYTLPVSLYVHIVQLKTRKLNEYSDWDTVHYGFDYVVIVTFEDLERMGKTQNALSQLSYWSYAISCALFFLFFGMGEESIATYKRWITRFGRKRTSEESDQTNSAIQTQISLPTLNRYDSAASLSEKANIEATRRLPGVIVTIEEDKVTS